MKKILLTLLIIFVSTFCHAQSWDKVYYINFIKFEDGTWVDDKSQETDNTFILIKGSEVIIRAKDINRYMTYGDCQTKNYDTHIASSWKCLDKEGDDCTFIMKRFNNGTIIYMIIYNRVGVEFYIK
jgi:hypothetical protein